MTVSPNAVINPAIPQVQTHLPNTNREAELRAAARELEASFLAEMLKHAGMGEARNAFGGGAGEEQFASFLRMEHAHAMAKRGGIGLAENLFHALRRREGLG